MEEGRGVEEGLSAQKQGVSEGVADAHLHAAGRHVHSSQIKYIAINYLPS